MANHGQIDDRDVEQVVLAELTESNTPGAAVAIVSGDRLLYAGGFGVSNVESGSPVTPDMLFRVGSLTKLLTATALISLLEERKVPLDIALGDLVKGLGPLLSRVSLTQVLSHSAGLIDYARICCGQDDSALAAQIQALADTEYFFTRPGSIFSYSNPGYIIAGYLIQELSGKPYAEAMSERLFEPLGMSRTTYRPTMAMTFPLSQGHDATGAARPEVVRPFVNNVGDWPAGFAYSTVFDLARFAVAFLNDGVSDGRQVLSPALIAALSTSYVDVPFSWDIPAGFFEGAAYGYGLFIQEHRGVLVLHHGGTIPGFGAFLVMAPAQRFGVIVLANRTAAILSRTLQKAMELMLPLQPVPERQPRVVQLMTPAEMEGYAGTYVNGALSITLFVRDGVLFRKDFYPSTAEEGPGRDYEAPVQKIGAYRFAFTPPGDTSPTEFVLLPDSTGELGYLHSAMQTAQRR